MNLYNITITPDDIDEGEAVQIEAFAEDLETMQDIINDTLAVMPNAVEFHHAGRYVVIQDYSEGGYYYHIYSSKESYKADDEDIDGGLCTTTLSNAIDMALNN